MNLTPELLEKLRNPLNTSGPQLILEADTLTDPETGQQAAVQDGIPQLLPESISQPTNLL
jgi:uncharacterized protein YbaR (Trm112 family)